MQELPLFEDPVPKPDFDEIVRQLDTMLDESFLSELEPALEDLFLARVRESGERAA